MKALSPSTSKGRTVSVDDVHHKTRDNGKALADSKAKSLRHAARQEGRAQSNCEPQSLQVDSVWAEAYVATRVKAYGEYA